MKKIFRAVTALLLASSIALTACSHSSTIKTKTSREEKFQNTASKDFHTLTDRLFNDVVSESVLSVNSVLDNPKDFGITDYKYTLGDVTKAESDKSTALMQDYLTDFKQINSEELSDKDKIVYDIITTDLDESIDFSKYYLYTDYLSPLYGMPSSLPSYLGQFTFNQSDDVHDYIEILKLVPDYFDKIVTFQKTKTDAGITMPDFEIDEIIDQCNEFVKDKDEHFLISTFNDRIKDTKGLSDSEKKKLKSENKKIVTDEIFPAYEKLAKDMEQFKGKDSSEGGLCKYPDGSDYYEKLLRSETGSTKTVSELQELLTEKMYNDIQNISSYYQQNPDIFNEKEEFSFDSTDPDAVLKYLIKNIKNDFPSGYETNYTINYVPKSMEKYESPAFYFIPQIDNTKINNIFINNNDDYNYMSLYHVLAHEGFPGHMYQSTYFQNTNPDPIRSLFRYDGYVEGWGLYAELYSYDISGNDESSNEFYKTASMLSYDAYCLCDIGINYNGWDRTRTRTFLATLGYDVNTSDQIFNSMIENPCAYIKYYLGYLEIMDMRNRAESELGDNFDLKSFHKFILDIGPAQFEIINSRFEKWLEDQK